MIPFGSRLLLGATLVATVGAIIYGLSNGGALGTIGLISLAVAFGVLTALNLAFRDANISSLDTPAIANSPAARRAPASSFWPAVGALGAVLIVIGLVTAPVVFIFGVLAVGACAAEWMVEAWSERASADALFNGEVPSRISHPIEFPVLAALAAGVIVYSFSRIMLFLSKTGGPVVFGVIGAVLLLIGFLFAYRPSVKGSAMLGVAGIGLVGLVAGGVAAALGGEREMEVHETTGYLAAEGHCDTAEETHADERASQTVAAKANVSAEVILADDGVLGVDTIGFDVLQESVTFARSTSSNVLFRNNSDEERRLVLDLGERAVVEDGEETDEMMPNQLCTALVEPGGTQLLTVSIGTSTVASGAEFSFFVPGVDSARLPVVVP